MKNILLSVFIMLIALTGCATSPTDLQEHPVQYSNHYHPSVEPQPEVQIMYIDFLAGTIIMIPTYE